MHARRLPVRAGWVTGALLAALLVASAPSRADEVDLGPAPLHFAPQDARDWVLRITPRIAPTRDQVAALYTNVYLPGAAVPLGWTGSITPCIAGTTSAEHQQAVLGRINYYRALVDLPPVALAGSRVAEVQQAAMMMAVNNMLSHNPPPSWSCWTALGAQGAANSNLALGVKGVDAIDLYMDDAGAGNNATGHRRWLLHPPQMTMATGDTAGGSTPPRPANALFIFNPFGARPATPNGIAWPPAGFVPYQNLPVQSNRWSFSFPGANFANATVTLAGPAGPIPVSLEPVQDGFGDNTLVFLPTGFNYGKPGTDTSYTVKVSGITGAGVPTSVQYIVTVIDSAVPSLVSVIEYYHSGLDHYFITWLADEIAKLDAGTVIKGWTRTGKSFKAYASAQPGTTNICRIYIIPVHGDSHFFGRGQQECDNTMNAHPDFILEEPRFMAMFLPVGGVCPAGTVPVYRVFSNRTDANHRYTIERAVRTTMTNLGWLAEGDGPDLVVLCAPA